MRGTSGPVLAALLILGWPDSARAASPETLTVYSDRHQEEDAVLFAAFSKETGIGVTVVDDEPEALTERLDKEGASSPADLLILVGAAPLSAAAEHGLLRPIASDAVIRSVPDALHDRQRRWVALSWWARVVAYRTDRFAPADVARYESLADPKFTGQILVRSASSPYNRMLVASLIAADGVEDTETWARAVVQNFARPPQGGDTNQIEALGAGEGGVAIVNTRYWARLAASDKVTEREMLDGLALAFPNQDDRGAEIDVVGAAVVRHSVHVEAAERLLDYLLRADAQQRLAAADFDFPARAGVPLAPTLQALGSFKTDSIAVGDLGQFASEASEVLVKADWD